MKKLILLSLILLSFGSNVYAEDCVNCSSENFDNMSFIEITRLLEGSRKALDSFDDDSEEDKKLDLIFSIIDNGDVKAMKKLLESGLDPNKAIGGRSILWNLGLYYSIDDGSAEEVAKYNRILEAVLKQSKVKVNVNIQNSSGDTPLMDAALGKNFRALELLLEHGADPYLKNKNEYTVLSFFPINADKKDYMPYVKSLKALKDHGVDINTITARGASVPVRVISSVVKAGLIHELLKMGADYSAPRSRNYSILLELQRNVEGMKVMIEESGSTFIDRDYILPTLKGFQKGWEGYEEKRAEVIKYLESIEKKK